MDPLVLEDSLVDKKTPIEDFMSVIPEKNRSKMFEDIKDYFCYVQIERGATSLSKTIPTEDICNICRAMGFFPTDKEIEDMVNEVKYMDYMEDGKLRTDINLEEFVKLFINHRPTIREDEISELQKVFKVLSSKKNNENQNDAITIESEDLLNFLKTNGDVFKERDIKNYLKPLFDGISLIEKPDDIDASEPFQIEQSEITFTSFVNDVLKMKDNGYEKIKHAVGDNSSVRDNIKIVLNDDDDPSKDI